VPSATEGKPLLRQARDGRQQRSSLRRPAAPADAGAEDRIRRPQQGTRRTLLYLSLDVSDSQLRFYPEFVPWLTTFEQPTVLLKIGPRTCCTVANFRKVRGVVARNARA